MKEEDEGRNDQIAWIDEWKTYNVVLHEDKQYYPDAEDIY